MGFDISSVARFAGINSSALHHVFEKIVERSLIQCLKKIRIHQARLMTVSNDLSVYEAAYELGFNNASQFSQ